MVLITKSSPPKTEYSLFVAHAVNVAVFFIILNAATAFENVETAMAFYGVYHSDPVNQAIHFVGVPLLLWTLLVFQAHLTLLAVPVSLLGVPKHNFSWATLSVTFYCLAYLRLDLVGGLMYLPLWYLQYSTAVRWARKNHSPVSWMGSGNLLQWALVFHMLAWYVQIHPGHLVFEGATPAAAQSVGGALYTAPLFAFYEGIWALGFRSNLQHRVLHLVDIYTQELCANGAVMRACESM